MYLISNFVLSNEFVFYKAVKCKLAEDENCSVVSVVPILKFSLSLSKTKNGAANWSPAHFYVFA